MKRGVDKRFDGSICYAGEMTFREDWGWTVRKSWFMVVVVWTERGDWTCYYFYWARCTAETRHFHWGIGLVSLFPRVKIDDWNSYRITRYQGVASKNGINIKNDLAKNLHG